MINLTILECPTINSSNAGVSVLKYAINESSNTDDKDNKISTLPRQWTVSHITATDLVFDQSQNQILMSFILIHNYHILFYVNQVGKKKIIIIRKQLHHMEVSMIPH